MGHGHVLSEKRIAPTEKKVKAALVKAGKRRVTAYEVEAYLMANGDFADKERGVSHCLRLRKVQFAYL